MNKKVVAYDKNNNRINEYDSAKIAANIENIDYKKLLRCIKFEKTIDGILYKYDDTIQYMKKQMVECANCGKEFMCEPWRIRTREHLFCSTKCCGEFVKNKSELNCTCVICGKKIHRKQSKIDKNNNNYCSMECHKKAKQEYMKGELNHQYGLKGNLNASWKSDEKISYYGYRLIRSLDHPFKNVDDFVFEHKLVAEKYLLNENNSIEVDGKLYLHPDYIVHHKDFDRLNNDVSNLAVMTLAEHTALHWKLRLEDELKNYCMKNKLSYINVSKQKSENNNYHIYYKKSK